MFPAVPYYVRPDPPYFIEQPHVDQSSNEQPQILRFFPGISTTLTCAVNVQKIISGFNTIEMYWEFNGIMVKDPKMFGNVILSRVEPGRLNLIFQHLNESNAGRYRCIMQDGLFSIVSETVELTLYGKAKSFEQFAINVLNDK